jgi:DNA-binding LytR/AlgR family response regulator
MIEIALCDDDPAITGFLETTLNRYGHLLSEGLHIQVFHQGAAILAALNQQAGNRRGCPFDIIFLDIELGDTTGIAVAEQIRNGTDINRNLRSDVQPVLIFVSAHEAYCKQLFRFDTTAFLEKPIDEAEVKALLLRIYPRLKDPHKVFTYQVKNDTFRVPLGDILFFESRVRKIELVTRQDSRAFSGKLDAVEAQLKHPRFVRIHHSMLVNLDNVERFEKSTLVLSGGRTLALARNKQKEIRHKIMDYLKAASSEASHGKSS